MSRKFDYLGDVEVFLAVVEHGSFTAGAVALSTTPSVLSRAVTRLEARLGRQLLQRTTRRVGLTDAGRLYLEQVRTAFGLLDDAERDVLAQDGALAGRVRLSVPTTYGHYRLPPVLARFAQQYPQVQVELNITNRNVDLVAEGFDLAIRLGQLPDSGLVARKLEDAPLLLVLPGSRPSEITRMTPLYEQAVKLLKAQIPGLEVAVVAAGTVAADVAGRVAAWPFRAHVVQEADKYDAMKAANAALATSGTVSTELALAGAPMVIAYKIDGLSYVLMKRLVTAKHITLFNIAADEAIAPEFIQHEATPQALAKAVGRLLTDPEAAADQARRQTEALDLMGRGGPDPSELAADAVLRVIAAKAG